MINLQKKKYYLHYLILFFFTYIKFLPRLQDTPVSYDRLVNILYKLYFDSVSYKYLFTKYLTLGYGVEEILDSLKAKKYLLDYYYESNGIKKLCPNSSMKNLLQNFIDDLIEYFKYEG